MQWADIPWNPKRRVLRQFSGLWIVFFGGLAIWHGLVQGRTLAGILLAVLALGVGVLGLVRPTSMRPIFVGWTVLTFPIGWLVSRLLMAVVYYGVITPLGLVFRLIGRDVLARKQPADQSSYWSPKPTPAGVQSYFRQF